MSAATKTMALFSCIHVKNPEKIRPRFPKQAQWA